MRKIVFVFWVLVVFAGPHVLAGDMQLRYRSPDGAFTAVVVPMGRDKGAKEIADDAEYECRVDIYDAKGRRVWSGDFSSTDGDHGRGVAFALWSPDSQWFVFSTVSSGGHSPWHFDTFAWSRGRDALYLLDDALGVVVREKFSFVKPDVISLQVVDESKSADGPGGEPAKTASAGLAKVLAHAKPTAF